MATGEGERCVAVLGGAHGVEDDVYVIADLASVRAALASMVAPPDPPVRWGTGGVAEGEILCSIGPSGQAVVLSFRINAHGRLLGLIARARTLTLCHADAWGQDAEPLLDLALPPGTAAEVGAQVDAIARAAD